jgi:subtilisin-like proprotein convertase family protein
MSPRSRVTVGAAAVLALALILVPAATADASPTSDNFTYSGAPVPIPDGLDTIGTPGAAVSADLPVSGMTGVVSKVVLTIGGSACTTAQGSTTVGIAHSFVSDLKLSLIAPDGTSVLFAQEVGGSGNNICQAVFDDSASTNIETLGSTSDAPFTGTWQPQNSFSALNGVDPNGTWRLQAQDLFLQDTGTIYAFSLALETTPAFVLGAHTMAVSGSGNQNSTVTYTTTIGNNGGAASADNAGDEYVDVLPSGVTLVSANANRGTVIATVGSNTVTWNGSIPASGAVTITTVATVDADSTGTISNQGTVNYDSDDDATNDASAVTDDPDTGAADDATEFVAVDATAPSVTLTPTATTTSGTHVDFAVAFSEPVTGFTSDDVVLGGTAGADTVVVTGSGADYTVTVSGMKRSGTVTASIPAGAVQDLAGIASGASGTASVSVQVAAPSSEVESSSLLPPTGADPLPGVFVAVFLLVLGLVLRGVVLVRRRVTSAG